MTVNTAMLRVKNAILLGRAAVSFVDLVKNLDHLDRVFEISDAVASASVAELEAMCAKLSSDPGGAAAFADKPRLRVDLPALSRLPAGTLGRAFAEHLLANGLDPASIPTLPAQTDVDYLRAHFYETHDVWHAVTGFGADPAGELGLQAFYAAQTPSNLSTLLISIGLLNTAFFAREDRDRRFEAIARGWTMGKRATRLFGMRWDRLWTRPVSDVRAQLGIEPYVETLRAAA